MTYCLGIFSKEGVAGIADTRITSGTDTTVAKKVFSVQRNKHAFFIMTSGLRSVRDKAITYFGEVIQEQDDQFTKLYQAVNKFGEQVRRVTQEDRQSLEASGMKFNLHAIVGGQLEEDEAPLLFLLYPEGNWIQIGRATPYVIIGNSGFGNPILKRSLHFEAPLNFGLKSGFLSFDATRISANDVDYPIDVVVLRKNEFNIVETRFEQKDLNHMSEFWDTRLSQSIDELPADKLEQALGEKSADQNDAAYALEN